MIDMVATFIWDDGQADLIDAEQGTNTATLLDQLAVLAMQYRDEPGKRWRVQVEKA